MISRRTVLALVGGSAIVPPWRARAQQPERVRRIGLLFNTAPAAAETRTRLGVFTRACATLGWVEGRNLKIDFRGVETAEPAGFDRYTMELVALQPDLLIAGNAVAARYMQRHAGTTPIVFLNANEPVSAGLVASLARPGGTITGFAKGEYSIIAKVLQTLLEVAPNTVRILAAYGTGPAGVTDSKGELPFLEAAARSAGVSVDSVLVRDLEALQPRLAELAHAGQGGVIMPGFTAESEHLAALAARYRLPAIYQSRIYAVSGGLISYAPDIRFQWGQAATYLDRILRGEKPGDLPVQMPTKFELVINVKTAAALGLTIPPSLLARADEVIE